MDYSTEENYEQYYLEAAEEQSLCEAGFQYTTPEENHELITNHDPKILQNEVMVQTWKFWFLLKYHKDRKFQNK